MKGNLDIYFIFIYYLFILILQCFQIKSKAFLNIIKCYKKLKINDKKFIFLYLLGRSVDSLFQQLLINPITSFGVFSVIPGLYKIK